MDYAQLAALGPEIKRRIDESYAAEVDDPRWHMGASQIGAECMRSVWLDFRWVKQETFSGRMRRLFKRGHKEEPLIIEHLKRIGIEVEALDPTTGEQFRGSCVMGHYGGSGDGAGVLPPDLMGLRLQLECKTHNRKSFLQLVKHGVRANKPKHYIQMCVYGAFFGLEYGLYFAVNKDDDDIHIEVVKLEKGVAEDAKRKAEILITSKVAPARISASSAHFVCKQCHFAPICHSGMAPEKNCRSCISAAPGEGGTWHCERWGIPIPRDKAALGCQSWQSII
jgi:hypothetical protein